MGFPRQEYWSGLPFPSPRDLPHPGIWPGPPALQTDSWSYFLKFYSFIFIFGCTGSLLQCSGFSLQWVLLWSISSRCPGFSSCSTRAGSSGTKVLLPPGVWSLPTPGIEPVSPCFGTWLLYHCTTREVPILVLLFISIIQKKIFEQFLVITWCNYYCILLYLK